MENKKKDILRKRFYAHFFSILVRKNGVCLGRYMCPQNHGGKKVICKI